MKTYIPFVMLFFGSILKGQVVFRHLTTEKNTSGHSTRLDHPQLNGHPKAIIFIMPNWNRNGSDPIGVNYDQNAGVWYEAHDSLWTIFNQDTTRPMPKGVTFNVLIAPPEDKHYFTVRAHENNSILNPPNGFAIDNPITNNNKNALIIVTQNRESVYNNNSPIVHYANGNWRISNNGFLIHTIPSYNHGNMPPGARYNVMVIDNFKVPGFTNAIAFKHVANINNTRVNSNITILNKFNGNKNSVIFAIPYWGHGHDDLNRLDTTQREGPYNESPIIAKYFDSIGKRNWSIINANGFAIPCTPSGAKFIIVSKDLIPTITIKETVFQTESQIYVCISGADANTIISLEAMNVPLIENQRIQITTNSNGDGCGSFVYRYIRDWCSLTNRYRMAVGEIIARNSNLQIIARASLPIYNLYSRPVGGESYCQNRFTVTIKTGQVDDLRGGSGAFIKFHFRNGNTSTEFPLNNGEGWGGGSTQTRSFDVGANNPDELAGVTIRHDGTPHDIFHTYDNWNLDGVQVTYNGGVVLMNLNASPLIRFTGDLRFRRFNR